MTTNLNNLNINLEYKKFGYNICYFINNFKILKN